MSQENVELVRQGYEAFARGDIAWIVEELMDEDAAWYPAIAPLLGVGAIHGKQAVERFFRVDIAEGFVDFAAVPASIEDLGEVEGLGELVLVQVHYSGMGRASGAPVVLDTFALVTMRAGKLLNFHDYNTRAEALEAAGLEE